MIVSNSVKTFATELKVPVETLLEQLHAAGVPKSSGEDPISEEDKEKLLATLRKSHGNADGPTHRKKITLTKRQTSEIRQTDATGKSKTIQVEVRKKRVFVKRDHKSFNSEPIKDSDLTNEIHQSDYDIKKNSASAKTKNLTNNNPELADSKVKISKDEKLQQVANENNISSKEDVSNTQSHDSGNSFKNKILK